MRERNQITGKSLNTSKEKNQVSLGRGIGAGSSVFHTFVFAVLPVVSLLSYNIDGMAISDALRPLVVILLGACLLLLLLWKLLKNWQLASLICSLFLILFFSYGHVFTGWMNPSMDELFTKIGVTGRHDFLIVLWTVIFLIVTFTFYRLKKLLREVTYLFNVMAFVTLISPVYTITLHELRIREPWSEDMIDDRLLTPDWTPAPESLPDVYYFVLDGYGRADYLDQVFELDNTEFLEYLKSEGFYVAERSRGNYSQTILSVASSLNMAYLDAVQESVGSGSQDKTPLTRLIRWSQVQGFLEERGYQTVAFATGYRPTELEQADHYSCPPIRDITVMERLVMDTSGLVILHDLLPRLGLSDIYPGYQAHRKTIENALDQLHTIHEIPGPKFVFVHVIVPHPPFVFGPSGEQVEQQYPFTLMDGDLYAGTAEEYERGYRDQLMFINGQISEIIDSILGNSSPSPVIILQGDHGPGLGLDWEAPNSLGINERMAILNALYLPGVEATVLYPEISPVNSFRVIFNQYFHTDLPLLPDESYFSDMDHPYEFTRMP